MQYIHLNKVLNCDIFLYMKGEYYVHTVQNRCFGRIKEKGIFDISPAKRADFWRSYHSENKNEGACIMG